MLYKIDFKVNKYISRDKEDYYEDRRIDLLVLYINCEFVCI